MTMRRVLLALGVAGALVVSCGGDDDASRTVSCPDGTKKQLGDFANCVTYYDEVAKCCPSSAGVEAQATALMCAQGDIDAACKNAAASVAQACESLGKLPACQPK